MITSLDNDFLKYWHQLSAMEKESVLQLAKSYVQPDEHAGPNKQLKKSGDLYHKMIEEVEDYAILLLDENGIIKDWNKGAEKIKGYTEKEIIGKSFKVFYRPEDQKSGLAEKLIKQAYTKGKALHEGWRVRKDGTTFWGSIVLTALHDDSGRVIGFVKVTRDLTERKLAEDKLKQYAQELEFQNKELEQFVYAASHDMKEPLRKIIFYNSFITEDAIIQLPEKERTYLTRSVNAARRMQLLIDDLLAYSRTGLQNQNFEDVNLDKVLDEVIATQKEVLDEKQAVIERDKLPVLRGIGFQMRQLFDNLLNNAIKYHHPEKTPVIKITCEKVKDVNFNKDDQHHYDTYYKISIIDNGIGFDPSHAEKIFEIFHRLNEKNASQGSGIGLAICRKIVQNHKGFIEASGKPDEGARFDVYLPDDQT